MIAPAPKTFVTGMSTSVAHPPSQVRNAVCSGWLIARIVRDGASSGQIAGFLQLATGQWCPPSAATWFPLRSAAVAYASELAGDSKYRIGIVYRVRQSGSGAAMQGGNRLADP